MIFTDNSYTFIINTIVINILSELNDSSNKFLQGCTS